LDNLPPTYGLVSLADNPATAGFEDSTILRVNRFDEDSLFNEYLLCHGESLVLDASEYGASFVWNDGSTNSQYTVSQTGIYTIDVGSACEHLTVMHEVTATSCPFTVSLYQFIEPDSLYGCHNASIKFIVKNDSGEKRPNVSISETLPVGFSFLEVLRNPYGGNLIQGLPDNMFSIENMTLEIGTDTIELLVRVGEVYPGRYRFMGILSGLPQLMGPLRYSDDPTTLFVDSTSVQILGNQEDTLRFDTFICLKQHLLLDAARFGETFIWDDGSTSPQYQVTQPGTYHAIQLDGCHPQELFWDVAAAKSVTVDTLEEISIHQGEKIEIRPLILNQEDSLLVSWTDPLGNSLSCYDCIRPISMALENTTYTFLVSNTVCADSTTIKILVDDTRRIYAPNIFSPNDDGINDFFYLQSPDFGKILNFQITGRWGNQVFSTGNIGLNEPEVGWDGYVRGKVAQPGTYLWEALIEFIDGKKEVFAGGFTLIR
jgi:gliding motility-associated-like protein